MMNLKTHPLEVYGVYILLALALTVYLHRTKGDAGSIKPGSSFALMIPFKAFAAIFLFGVPGILVFSLPDAAHPRLATVATVLIVVACTAAFVAIISTKLVITGHGFALKTLGLTKEYRFDEFKSVSVFRFNLVLDRKVSGAANIMIPAFFSNLADLNAYLRKRIGEADQGETRAEESGIDY
jgi:hypothetical protein